MDQTQQQLTQRDHFRHGRRRCTMDYEGDPQHTQYMFRAHHARFETQAPLLHSVSVSVQLYILVIAAAPMLLTYPWSSPSQILPIVDLVA